MTNPDEARVTGVRLLDKPEGVIVQVRVLGGVREAPGLALQLQFALDDYFDAKPADLVRFAKQVEGATPFAQAVYEAVQAIPAGQTATYGEIARRVGSPKAARAVGTVMAHNPLPLLIPCHRVVAQSGPGGFGPGVALKRKLLALESEGKPLVVYLDIQLEGPEWGCMDGHHGTCHI